MSNLELDFLLPKLVVMLVKLTPINQYFETVNTSKEYFQQNTKNDDLKKKICKKHTTHARARRHRRTPTPTHTTHHTPHTHTPTHTHTHTHTPHTHTHTHTHIYKRDNQRLAMHSIILMHDVETNNYIHRNIKNIYIMLVKTNKNTWWITNTFRMFQLSPNTLHRQQIMWKNSKNRKSVDKRIWLADCRPVLSSLADNE